jgi:hypothetical protein
MVHMLTWASYPLRNLAITRDFATCLGSTAKGPQSGALGLHSALFGLDDLAENPVIKVSLEIVFIAIDEEATAGVLSCANDDEVGGLHARLREQLASRRFPVVVCGRLW